MSDDRRSAIEHLRDRIRTSEDIAEEDSEFLLQFSKRLDLLAQTYSGHRHEKLLRHGTIIAEQLDGGLLAKSLRDRDASETIVAWINANYDNVETNRDYRTALRMIGKRVAEVEDEIEEARAIQNDEYILKDEQELDYLEDQDIVLIDIETDLSQDKVWLIGLYSYGDEEFNQIFEKDNEEKLLKTFIKYLCNRESSTILYYGGNYFDERCLKNRMREHGFAEGVDLIANSHDLGIEIQSHILGGFRKIKLEYFASEFAGYEYEYSDLDGFTVGSMYTKYLLDGEEQDWDSILGYNKDDVMALKAVVDNIRELMDD